MLYFPMTSWTIRNLIFEFFDLNLVKALTFSSISVSLSVHQQQSYFVENGQLSVRQNENGIILKVDLDINVDWIFIFSHLVRIPPKSAQRQKLSGRRTSL